MTAEKEISAGLLGIVHDLQVFIRMWEQIRKDGDSATALLKEASLVTQFDHDEDIVRFTLEEKHYEYDTTEEALWLKGERETVFRYVEGAEPIESGPAHAFITRYFSVWNGLYRKLETEMEARGWEHDRDEYGHNLSKGGWSLTLNYFAVDFDKGVDDICYDPDQPGFYWYRPLSLIIHDACFQIKRDAGFFKKFTLSEIEGEINS